MRKWISFANIAALGLALAAVLAAPALACSCMRPGPPQVELEKSDAVFLGTVLGVEELSDEPFPRLRVTFRLLSVWKGVAEGEEVAVRTAADGAACGYAFNSGETYLVYAYGGQEGEELTTNLCTRNAPRGEAEEDLTELGEPERQVEAPQAR